MPPAHALPQHDECMMPWRHSRQFPIICPLCTGTLCFLGAAEHYAFAQHTKIAGKQNVCIVYLAIHMYCKWILLYIMYYEMYIYYVWIYMYI